LLLVAAACSSGSGRPTRLLNGDRAGEFTPVPESVLTHARVLRRGALGRRLDLCLFPAERTSVPTDAVVVERIGIVGESLTFANAAHTGVYGCDGGIDPAGERRLPWCGEVFGQLSAGRLLDPRLDLVCRDRDHSPLAYAFVEPVSGARWIGVDEGRYTEIYEVLAGLPVRVEGTQHVDTAQARARFDVTQYDVHGRELVRATLEASVAG
jgi:hypothetical protein